MSPARGGPFPRSYRLTRRREFAQVFARARRLGGEAFTVLAIDNDCGHPRLGMAIARRRLPRAVARNRVKRLIRETFREQAGEMRAVDIVVLARDAAARLPAASLRRELEGHWRALAVDPTRRRSG